MSRPDAKYVLDQHEYAKSLYGGALEKALEVERLFKSEYENPRDADDKKYAASPDVRKPALARAILEKFLSLTSLRMTQRIQVIPRDLSETELEASSKQERWSLGYQLKLMLETKRSPWRDGTYWYFLRGRGCWETRMETQYLGTNKIPIRTLADDPNCIFTVWDRDGVGYYTKEYLRSTRSLKKEIDKRRGGDKAEAWKRITLPDDENDDVTIIEYWDDTYCAALAGTGDARKLLYVRKHDYGFVPISEAHCMDTPLADMEWAFQSVLYPIMDSLKGQYALASKLATGVDLFYWPKILVESQSGQTVILDSGAPGVESYITPGSKVTVLNPTPNQAVLAQLMGWYKSDVQLGGIPDIAWGAEPSSLQSGFAVSQVLGQVMDKIAPHQAALEMAMGWDWSHKFQLVEKYGGVKGIDLSVPVEKEYAQADSIRNAYT